MRILVTGATGFTGRHFQTHAIQAGHEIVSLTADLTDRSSLAAEVSRAEPDAVLHLAAVAFVGHANTSAFHEVNVIGSLNLLDALAALRRQPSSVMLASSANIYGNCLQSPIKETQPPAPINPYAASKLAMEQMAMEYTDRLPIVITRPFNYTGPGQDRSFLIPKLVEHFARRASVIELGNLEVEREFNDVRMVCEAYLRLLGSGVSGQTYNVCTGVAYSLHQVLAILKDLTGHDIEVRVNPAFVRANEVHRLCGDPGKLMASIGSLPKYQLTDCLSTMLDAHDRGTPAATV